MVALQREEDHDGEQQTVEGPRADLRQEPLLVPLAALGLLPEMAGEEPGEQRDAEEDQHGLGDLPRRGVDRRLLEAQPSGQHREVEPAEHGEHDHLEDGVDRDQHGGRLAVAAGEVVPDDHHRDAAREADDDQAGPVFGQIRQEYPGQGEHQRRPEDPVQQQRAQQEFAVAGDGVETVVAHLRQHRVHHDQQTEGDRQGDAVEFDGAEGVAEAGDHPAQEQAGDHRDADPHRQEPVQGRELADNSGMSGRLGHRAASAATTAPADTQAELPTTPTSDASTADNCASAEGITR